MYFSTVDLTPWAQLFFFENRCPRRDVYEGCQGIPMKNRPPRRVISLFSEQKEADPCVAKVDFSDPLQIAQKFQCTLKKYIRKWCESFRCVTCEVMELLAKMSSNFRKKTSRPQSKRRDGCHSIPRPDEPIGEIARWMPWHPCGICTTFAKLRAIITNRSLSFL